MSFGVAQFDFRETPKSLIVRADKNLYRSKQEGRNRVSPQPHEADFDGVEIIDVTQIANQKQ